MQNGHAQHPAEQMNEHYKLELAEVFARINSHEDARVQLGTFVGTANLTPLGIALSTRKRGI